MTRKKLWKTEEEKMEQKRAYWQIYYKREREVILEKHRTGYYNKMEYYESNNNNIVYTDSSMNTLEKTPKVRQRKPPKTPLQRKRERIARDLEEVEKRANEFRKKLYGDTLNATSIENIESPASVEP